MLGISCRSDKSNITQTIVIDRFVNLLDTTEVLSEYTKVTLSFDSTGINFSAVIYDTDIAASIYEHGAAIYKDPCIELFLDPNADARDYYEFEINAAGYAWPLKLKSNASPLDAPGNITDWNIGAQYGVERQGTLNDSSDKDISWEARMFCPYSAIEEGAPLTGTVWAYNFMRIDYDIDGQPTYWVAQSTNREMIHYPLTWPKIYF